MTAVQISSHISVKLPVKRLSTKFFSIQDLKSEKKIKSNEIKRDEVKFIVCTGEKKIS